MRVIRGLEQRHEQDPRALLRDTRSLGKRIYDYFHNPAYVAVLLVSFAAASILMPELSDLIFLLGMGCFFYGYTRKVKLPFRMPRRSKLKDYGDPLPGTNKPRLARGITYFGNSLEGNDELWFNNDDMRTHVLIFGSTGSGKTEALLSMSFNSLVQGSGFIYVDGKGDNSLYAKVFSMCRRMGREDDLLLINFMTGARDVVGAQRKRLSNTMNPFAMGSSSMLSQLVVSLMDAGSNSSDGDMWKGRAITFVEALMKVLVYMRDKGHILLDANTIRNYFVLERLEAMVMDKQFLRDNQEPVSLTEAPPEILEPLNNYIFNLPGYDKAKKGKQVSQVLEQHGFITMQLTRVFSSLADTYGHIIRTNLAEVDMKDVVLNRRILVVLLPALEKSPDELANLGKIIIASLKAMMAAGLGDEVEGDYRDVILRKPTNAPTPYVCVLDEYGYYAVPGFAVVPAQARSLGFSAIFAGQDLPAFQKASKEEAASIGANTNIKIAMKLEDPVETWEFFSKTAGEAYVTKVDSFQTNPQSVLNHYMDTRSSSVEKRARIDLLDLKEQDPGQAHVFFKSMIVRAKLFYAAPPPVKEMQVNQFLKVERVNSRTLFDLENRLAHFQSLLNEKGIFEDIAVDTEELDVVFTTLNASTPEDPIERGVAALLAYHNRSLPVVEEEEEELPNNELNIFVKLRSPPEVQAELFTNDLERFANPILNKNLVRNQVEAIERLSGRLEKHAINIAVEIVKDMELATNYPPVIVDAPSGIELADITRELISRIQLARSNAAMQADDD